MGLIRYPNEPRRRLVFGRGVFGVRQALAAQPRRNRPFEAVALSCLCIDVLLHHILDSLEGSPQGRDGGGPGSVRSRLATGQRRSGEIISGLARAEILDRRLSRALKQPECVGSESNFRRGRPERIVSAVLEKVTGHPLRAKCLNSWMGDFNSWQSMQQV